MRQVRRGAKLQPFSSPPLRRAAVEVVVKPARGQGGVRERFLEQLLCGVCEKSVVISAHPHTALSIVLQITTDQGSVS